MYYTLINKCNFYIKINSINLISFIIINNTKFNYIMRNINNIYINIIYAIKKIKIFINEEKKN